MLPPTLPLRVHRQHIRLYRFEQKLILLTSLHRLDLYLAYTSSTDRYNRYPLSR